ncbi:MAG: hypothetical protein ACP5SJ_03820 [Candidatus Micrarchaeia archaeon]
MARNTSKTEKKDSKSNTLAIALIITIIAAIIALSVVVYLKISSSGTAHLNSFRSSFDSAPRVNIYVDAQNGTALASTVDCATALIEKIIETPQTHRSPSTIGYYVMNSTSCVYSSNGLGVTIKNYTYTTAQNCLNFSKGVPSIFLNYSAAENSTYISGDNLYVVGDAQFMQECGIAYSLTS